MHLLNGGYFIPQNGDLQFSHMGKVFPQQQEQLQTNAEQSQNRETVEPTLQPGNPNNTDNYDPVEGGSKRSMDNVPVNDMKKSDGYGGHSNGESSANTSNSSTNNTTTTDSSSKVNNSTTNNNTVKHGASNYQGDTSTYVTNNFFNPPIQNEAWEDYPRGAKLELQYLWKRINAIDDKLDKLLPIPGGDPKLDPNNRKGLIITFDSLSDPDKPTVDLQSKHADYDML
ncbi:putative membrane protein [Babesia divergens]|uniref:Membrane protein n=1 Tax=Babesia divergens TaxID=32595 RepID=A0AAD9GHM3_BABDI|nr:putative membrane protein [Babesia divergens]